MKNEMTDLLKSLLFDTTEMERSRFRFELIYMLFTVIMNIWEDVGDPFQYFSGNVKTNQFLGRLTYLKKYRILELNERNTICR